MRSWPQAGWTKTFELLRAWAAEVRNWPSQVEAQELLPWRTSRAAINAIAEAILNGGTAITAMSMPQLSE
ncbi:MAG: hypothetical protein QOG57_967 [Pseudonocardiales bacterium]|nr:hypothetical protein [Pseudonocardiales bacterium]